MILITSAKYSSSDFNLEFGRTVPSFLPLGNKRLYEYQARLLAKFNMPIYLSLPSNFKISPYDKEKLKELNINLIFANENLSLGESIVYCINLFYNLNENLLILHGDTFFQSLDCPVNSIQVARPKDNYEWTFLDDEFNVIDKNYDENLAICGAFFVQFPRVLVKEIVKNEYNFIKGLKTYSKQYPFKLMQNDTWLDFGLITSYFHSKKIISSSRSFNSIHIENNYLEKSSKWLEKIRAESAWFKNLPKELLIYTPRFLEGDDKYFLEYLYNNTLAEIFVFGKLPSFVYKQIFMSLKTFLNTLHSYKSEKKINFNYKEKTLQRLNTFAKDNNFNLNESLIINGKKYDSVLTLIDKLNKFLNTKQDISLIHGDFCFSNIMYDFRSNLIKTYDPRGMDFDLNITSYGDKNYDLAKLAHSVLGLYDFIIAGFYECSFDNFKINFSIQVDEDLQDIQENFKEIFNINEEILAIMIHLFLSMLPLHSDSKERQFAFLANAFLLYERFLKDDK
ncbi:capsular biosynthesis protein [Campylobacter sp. LR264d]|uniref:capsular biosynthesis protein n=1 Tax=Campylobacter sp. LR264d TaxID=2593544 RepID=UPI001239DAC4|nr:capsular biosynthesis protein [Campylobacter sp. LR264d]KAA6229831.1 capsular biosynthesis protein [Campylobacter sp. LR264d]